MSATRLAIRDRLVLAMADATGLTVHRNLDYALEAQNLPAGAVNTVDDAPDPDTEALGGVIARFSLAIVVANSADPEKDADEFEERLRARLKDDPTLDGVAIGVWYVGGEWDFSLGDCAVRRLFVEAKFIN